jgi:hypothetical protein
LLPHALLGVVAALLLAAFGTKGALLSPAVWLVLVWWMLALFLHSSRALGALTRNLRLRRWSQSETARLAVFAGAIAAWLWFGGGIGPILSGTSAATAGLLLGKLIVRGLREERHVSAELMRLAVVLGVSLFLVHPYVTPRLVGAGDAEHYGRSMSDFLSQTREGIFPVWVGQSRTAFHGSVHPLRVAPYFQHAGGALDVATGRSLSPIAVQNLLIVLSLLAAALGAYAVLSSLAERRRWSAALLALLYVSSPGVLALAYAGDMYASWLTLPWLPWLFWGWVQAWRRPESWTGLGAQATSLAMLWLAHAPIALWASLLTLGSETARWAAQGFRRTTLLRQAGTAGACALLCHYVFVSVISLDVPANPYLGFDLARGAVYASVVDSWAGLLRTVSPGGADLMRDLHLGPGLLLAGLAALAATWRGDGAVRTCCAAAAALFLLMVPWPGVTDHFWSNMPAFFMTVSEKWPAQRIYPVLSALVPIAAMLALTQLRSQRARHLVSVLLAFAVLASVWEARKFLNRGSAVTRSEAATQKFLLPENSTISRYSYEMWGYLPDHFSFGYMDAENQNRLIDPVSGEVRVSNLRSLTRAVRREREISFVPTRQGAQLPEAITIPPRSAVTVRFQFHDANVRGTLVFTGQRISRRFEFPVSGGPRAFGPGPLQSKSTTLRNASDTLENVRVEFFNEANESVTQFAKVQSVIVNREQLPVRLADLTPFQLQLNLDQGGWLETPKVFLRDYRVRVNGRYVAPDRSPNGLLMFPVAAGRSDATISYEAPWYLRAAYWSTWGAWVAALIGSVLLLRQPTRTTLAVPRPSATPLRKWLTAAIAFTSIAAGTLWAITRDERSADSALQQLSNTAPISLRATFPVGRHEVYETLLSWKDEAGDTMSVVVFYQDDRHVRIGCRKRGVLKLLSDPLPMSYFVAHRISLQFERVDTMQVQVRFNGHPLWTTDCAQRAPENWTFGFGRDLDEQASPDGNPFRGRLVLERSAR